MFVGIPYSVSKSKDIGPLENPEPQIEKMENSCLPSAIIFKETFDRHNIWSRIVFALFKIPSEKSNHIYGHTFVEYLYPRGSTNLWIYDNTGSWKADYSIIDDPVLLTKKVFEDNGNDFEIDKAKFFEYK